MSTEMFQTSIQSIKQLSARLSTFFRHGLATNQVLISLVLVRQFSFNRNYHLALVNSLSDMAKLKCCSTAPAFVDMILQWTMPQMNKKQEVGQSSLALKLVEEVGQFVWEDSKYSFQFVYHQIRARLLGSSKTDFSQESNYGVLCYETKSILLDILIAMCRLKDPKSPGGFFLEPRLVMAGSVKSVEVEENNNNGVETEAETETEGKSSSYNSVFFSEKPSLKQDEPGEVTGEEHKVKPEDRSIYTRSVMTASIRSSSVKLLTPQMIEDDMKSRMSSCLLSNYKTPHFNAEEDEDVLSLYEDPVDSVLYDQKGGEAQDILGYLVASDGSRTYEISNFHCIGRDPRCSVILEGKEISRLHARVKTEQGEVQLESLSETSLVRINAVPVKYVGGGGGAHLSSGDVVELGRQVFTWQSDLSRH